MQCNRSHWKAEDYLAFVNYLKSEAEEPYRQFSEKTVKPEMPGEIIGIRSPILKGIAKEICKGNFREFLAVCHPVSYEERTLMGFVLSGSNMDYKEFEAKTDAFLTFINNWAICDSFCSSLKKPLKNHKEAYWHHIEHYLCSQHPWTVRVGLISMLSHYLEETYIDEVLERCDRISSEFYYIRMAQAWLVATALGKFPEKTKTYLLNSSFDDWTFNKTIQKACESYRIAPEDKTYLKTLKKEKSKL